MSHSEAKNTQPNILLLMSGSIACAKASSLISQWTKRGHSVRVGCTRSVAEFVAMDTMLALGAETVFDNVFASGQTTEHISLGRWADIVIAAPATSNLINKLAAGIADDAVSTVWQAAYGQGKPMIIVPAMNTRMWRYPATRKSVRQLKQWGISVFPVGTGELACGENGEGRLLEPAAIIHKLDHLLGYDQLVRPKRILITAGGTRERIDSVRYIGNRSSGLTAAQLAGELAADGHSVTWLGAEDAVQPAPVSRIESYYSFTDLEAWLRNLLGSGEYDVVIHAAAVSDFSVTCIESGEEEVPVNGGDKLSSGSDLVLHLKPNPKLLDSLKSWSANPALQVIGFKLTDTQDLRKRNAAITRQFEQAGVDAVVHNDLSEISRTAHPFDMYAPSGERVHCKDSRVLAKTINEFLGKIQ